MPAGRTAMVQPYVASVDARGETALPVFFDGAFSHAIHKGALLARGDEPTIDVFAAEHIQPAEATAAERALAQRIVDWATERLGVDALTYARVDVVEDADGAPILLELELTEPSLFFAGDADGSPALPPPSSGASSRSEIYYSVAKIFDPLA